MTTVQPALAAGCTVVMKPPELAPFGSNLFARLCLEAGLPPGVVNVVPGGPAAGDALVSHPDVDKISFTGGPRTARLIQAACAESLTPLVLELGGKSPCLVFPDADLPRAAISAADGVIRLAGQICVAPSRLFVEHSVYDEVVDRVVDRLAGTRVGDPFDPTTEMGPLISRGACDRVVGLVDAAQERGDGKLLVGGQRPGGDLQSGFYMTPAAFGDVDNSSPIAQEEIFGPVLCISRFEDEAEAVELANATTYGLAAYLHTGDVCRIHRIVDQLDAGNVAVNGGTSVNGPYAPFGGFKDSGYGTEGGPAGLGEFVRVKNVNINVS
jgi:aldehyde dehydrogenase (NAD+)